MEAIAGVNRGGIAGCSCPHRESVASSGSGQRNLVSPGTNYYVSSRRGSLRMMRQAPFSSAALQDQSHVQYYLHAQHRVRKDGLTNSVSRKAVACLDEAVVEERVRDKAVMKVKKMEMKTQKKLKKASRVQAGLSSSSSSSSSSESDTAETTKAGSRKTGVDLEKLRKEYAAISQSPLMNSIPTISSSFVIEQPSAAQQIASPVASSVAAKQAEIISSAGMMAMRISSGVDVSSNAYVRQSSMAGAPVRCSSSADTALLEVCMGGKCKKAGAEEVLSAFMANGVNASAGNKCMKKCKLAVNVRVHQDGDNVPQMYSGIGVQDVNVLSRKHFGPETASREAIQV